jgi:hypothetical protein
MLTDGIGPADSEDIPVKYTVLIGEIKTLAEEHCHWAKAEKPCDRLDPIVSVSHRHGLTQGPYQ